LLTHVITLEYDIEPESLRIIGEHQVENKDTVVHIVNHHEFDTFEGNGKATHTIVGINRKLVTTLVLSIALHAIAFYIISLRIQLPSFIEQADEPVIVQAKLHTPPPTTSIFESEVVEPVVSEPVSLREVEPPPTTRRVPSVARKEPSATKKKLRNSTSRRSCCY
jgi:hypothetical protein